MTSSTVMEPPKVPLTTMRPALSTPTPRTLIHQHARDLLLPLQRSRRAEADRPKRKMLLVA